MNKITTHLHEYIAHPKWETHVYCRICGFALPLTQLAYAVKWGAIDARTEKMKEEQVHEQDHMGR